MLCYIRMWLLLDCFLHNKYFVRSIDSRAIAMGQKKNSRNLSKPHFTFNTSLVDGTFKNDTSGKHSRFITVPSSSGKKDHDAMREEEKRKADFILQWKLDSNTTSTLYAYRYNLRPNCCFNSTKPYDSKGAMYFAIAVILFYGISIALLVAASTLKRSRTDYELKGFLRSYARIEEEKRTREKQLVRTVLQQRNLLHLWPGAGHRPSFLSRVAHLESLRRASRTSACSNATSKKSSIDRTSLLEAINEERRRASFPEKRVTALTEMTAPVFSNEGSLFKTRSCAEVVVAGLGRMMECEENGNLKQSTATGSAPASTAVGETPRPRNKLQSFRCKTDSQRQRDDNNSPQQQQQLQQQQQQNQQQQQQLQRSKHKKHSTVLSNLPLVTVELFEDAKEPDGSEVRKVEVHDDLIIHGTIKKSQRRRSEICLKNFIGS